VREVVEPRWPYWRPPLGSLDGLTRPRQNGVLRLLHVDGAPVVVAISGRVFAARAASEDAANEGIARMKFAAGVDDDLAEFHERFRDDPVIGRAVRARPWVRVRRNPTPWETLAWSITEQLITMERATGIQKAIIRAHGPRHGALRDSPAAATIAARAPAELDACGLHPKRSLAMIRAARIGSFDERRLLAIRDIGTWTIEMLALHGFGRLDVIPAGDLGYLKLVGRLTTGNPRAIADEDEVRGFMAPYAPWAGMAAQYLSRATRPPAPRPAGTRWSAASPPRAAA
jgi:3-methyladenine DNA glycosylase/8-oxoguanine DNA glycosylase